MAAIPIVNTIDRRRGIIAAIIVMIGLLLYLFLATIEMADPPPEEVVLEASTIFPEELVLENFKVEGSSLAGNPNDKEVTPITPQTEQVLTQNENPDHQVQSGQGNTTTANNSNNPPSNQVESNDPFAPGGNDTGDGPGSDPFGESTGPGNGGNGNGSKARVRLNDPVFDRLQSNEYATITLVLTIDADGNIISATCNKAATTTSDQILINKVIYEVKKQVKYNKDPGSPLVKVQLPVKVTPK